MNATDKHAFTDLLTEHFSGHSHPEVALIGSEIVVLSCDDCGPVGLLERTSRSHQRLTCVCGEQMEQSVVSECASKRPTPEWQSVVEEATEKALQVTQQ